MQRWGQLGALLIGLNLCLLLVAPRVGRSAETGTVAEQAGEPGLVASYYRMTEAELSGQCHALEDIPEVPAGQEPVAARVEDVPLIKATFKPLLDINLRDNFYVRWSGKIRIPRDDVYVFSTTSDDGSLLYIDDELVVENGGQHILQEVKGKISLRAGDHDIKIEYFDSTAEATLKVAWTIGDGLKESLPAAVLFHQPAGQATLESGLWAEYFDFNDADFPEPPPRRRPVLKQVEATVDLKPTTAAIPGTRLVDKFFVRWTGTIRIPRTGRFSFFTVSDDGSRLLIDGRVIVSNEGFHLASEVIGGTELKAGDHEIEIEYFDNTAEATMKAGWLVTGMKGVERHVLPPAMLFHMKSAEK